MGIYLHTINLFGNANFKSILSIQTQACHGIASSCVIPWHPMASASSHHAWISHWYRSYSSNSSTGTQAIQANKILVYTWT